MAMSTLSPWMANLSSRSLDCIFPLISRGWGHEVSVSKIADATFVRLQPNHNRSRSIWLPLGSLSNLFLSSPKESSNCSEVSVRHQLSKPYRRMDNTHVSTTECPDRVRDFLERALYSHEQRKPFRLLWYCTQLMAWQRDHDSNDRRQILKLWRSGLVEWTQR